MKNKKHRKDRTYSIFIVCVLAAYLAIMINKLFFYSEVWWDSAAYVGMGKYIFSLGNFGLWEPVRPLVWPVILGFFWKIGLNPLVFGKAVTILLSAGIGYFVYEICNKIFSKRTGIIAVILLLFTPTYFLSTSQLVTGIPSTFFGILAFYLYLNKKYFYTGLFFGLAFMTRFLQLYLFLVIIAILIITNLKRLKVLWKKLLPIILGFLIPVTPYLILNSVFYGNPIFPFLQQAYMARYTGWFWWEPLTFYFKNIFFENYLSIFSLIGIYIVIKSKKIEKTTVLAIFLFYFIFYNIIAHKEMRFLVTLMPYFFILVAEGLNHPLGRIKSRLLSNLILVFLFLSLIYFSNEKMSVGPFSGEYTQYYEYLNSKEDVKNIWITNPLYILETNAKADLIYYPTFDYERAKYIQKNVLAADHVFFNQCDIPCPPWDNKCPEEKDRFIQVVEENFEKKYLKENEKCDYYIFSSKT